MKARLSMAMFGSSLVSAYWNGAATYYRGVIRGLDALGCDVTFFEPDAYDRQKHRDIEDPPWARVHVYRPDESGLAAALEQARSADIVVKASGVGIQDELLETLIPDLGPASVYWDVDAPATLARMQSDAADPLRARIGDYDLVLTYGGGDGVVARYRQFGAAQCVPIYNAVDPDVHHPVEPDARFAADLSFLGNRLPDREERVASFLFDAARRLPARRFLLGGNGWDRNVDLPANVRAVGHVYTRDHNAFNSSALAVININRDSMASSGYSPPTRVFEAAGAGACLLCDRWQGLADFLEPGTEVLEVGSGGEVAATLSALERARARRIGAAARRRVLAEHTYAHRAEIVWGLLRGTDWRSRRARPALASGS